MSDWVLVSGAGTGIGQAVAAALADAGHRIVLTGRREAPLQETAGILAGEGHKIVTADLRDAAGLRQGLADSGIESLYGVVANAGVGGENQYGAEDRWQEIIDTNLTGTYQLVNEALPYLRADRASDDFRHVLIISSILARLGVPGYTAYCASKAGLLGLMRSWAASFTGERILVNALCPGWVNTAMARQGIDGFAQAFNKTYDEALAEQMAMVPLGKMSEPAEVAAFTAYLLGRGQVSITGQTLDINNGALMPC